MKILRWFFVGIAVFGLIGVRMSENTLFYDPFLEYFRELSPQSQFPTFEWGKLILHYVLRFSFNLLFFFFFVHFLFQNKRWTLQALVLMVVSFLIFLPIYLYCINNQFEIGHLFSFYIRRFVIQPLMILLIVPLFYYRKTMGEN